MVRVCVLGGLRVEGDDGDVALPPSHKARLLLGMLAVERRVHGRSELAGRLWPDVREDSARASLRNALAQLRGALGEYADRVLVADGAGGLALAGGVATDLEMDDPAPDLDPQRLLAGFDDDWVQQRRDDLRDRLVAAVGEQAAAAEGAGDLDEAIRLSRRVAALDPLAESAHRDLIRRLAAAGDRGAGLAVYERLRDRLAGELRVAPSGATRVLVEELRGGSGAAPATATAAPSRVRYAQRDSQSLAYQRFGSGSADLVVVPGWVSNLDEIWGFPPLGPLLARLGEFASGVVFDKRGTGLSERDLGFGSLEERADDIRAVMDAAGLARASLFAFSESAALATVFAAAHPDRVENLILYSAYARMLAAPGYPGGLPPELVGAFVDRIARDWGAGSISRVSIQGAPDTPAAEQILGRWERSVCTPKLAAQIIRLNADIDIRALLPTVQARTLVLHSTGDTVAPPALGRYVAEHIPGARYLEHDTQYHLPWDGGSAWFLDPIEELLAGEPRAPRRSRAFLSTVLCVAGGQGERVRAFDSPSQAVEHAASLGVAAGIHTGEVERVGGDLVGATVDAARDLAARAHPGEVLVSRIVRDLTAGSGLLYAERDGDSFAYAG
jgi:DNA-binding SARP family transcriptional activator/pimeloyl-ACP methyl ester carboxylesterase